MAVTGSGPDTRVDINVTPMIDVLLVLLVMFFLLNLPMPHINVVVPPPAVAGPPSTQLVLELPDGGGYQLNGQPVPDDQLDVVLQNALGPRVAKLVFVGAGEGRRYQEVVTAIDRARGAGAEVVAFLPPRTPLR